MHFGYRKEIGWAHFETTQSRSIARRRRGTFHCHHAASIRHRHSSLEESRRGLSPAPVVSRFRDSQSKRPPKSHISITEYPWHWRVNQYGASACGSADATIQFAREPKTCKFTSKHSGRECGYKRSRLDNPQARYKARRQSPGLVSFVTTLAFHFCLALRTSFTQPGDHLLAEPCRWNG